MEEDLIRFHGKCTPRLSISDLEVALNDKRTTDAVFDVDLGWGSIVGMSDHCDTVL